MGGFFGNFGGANAAPATDRDYKYLQWAGVLGQIGEALAPQDTAQQRVAGVISGISQNRLSAEVIRRSEMEQRDPAEVALEGFDPNQRLRIPGDEGYQLPGADGRNYALSNSVTPAVGDGVPGMNTNLKRIGGSAFGGGEMQPGSISSGLHPRDVFGLTQQNYDKVTQKIAQDKAYQAEQTRVERDRKDRLDLEELRIENQQREMNLRTQMQMYQEGQINQRQQSSQEFQRGQQQSGFAHDDTQQQRGFYQQLQLQGSSQNFQAGQQEKQNSWINERGELDFNRDMTKLGVSMQGQADMAAQNRAASVGIAGDKKRAELQAQSEFDALPNQAHVKAATEVSKFYSTAKSAGLVGSDAFGSPIAPDMDKLNKLADAMGYSPEVTKTLVDIAAPKVTPEATPEEKSGWMSNAYNAVVGAISKTMTAPVPGSTGSIMQQGGAPGIGKNPNAAPAVGRGLPPGVQSMSVRPDGKVDVTMIDGTVKVVENR